MLAQANKNYDYHEEIVFFTHSETGLAGVIAIHSTALGPAAGGCRCKAYLSADEALSDALRLSQGMSFKNAVAGLPVGGGKAVIFEMGPSYLREAAFEAFGREVDKLGGRYLTAEDVGTSVVDLCAVARATRYVAGLPPKSGLAGGDPSPWTARGVFLAMSAAAPGGFNGVRVAVQGLGAVGMKLCAMLSESGASLVVADADTERALEAKSRFGATIVPIHAIHKIDAAVFSPNALGGLSADTIAELGAPVVCGGANNQLATPADGARLLERGVTHVPDYVANAGGIINVMAEYLGETTDLVEQRVDQITGRVRTILEGAVATRRPTNEFADDLARDLMSRKRLKALA